MFKGFYGYLSLKIEWNKWKRQIDRSSGRRQVTEHFIEVKGKLDRGKAGDWIILLKEHGAAREAIKQMKNIIRVWMPERLKEESQTKIT